MTSDNKDNPRTKRMRDTVLKAGCELLVSSGGEAVTALKVSERTGVSRSAIYRHWPEPSDLLLDVVKRVAKPRTEITITESLEADLTTALHYLRARMCKRPFRSVFGTLLDNANRDPRFVEPQRQFVEGMLMQLTGVLLDATQRGILPPTLDIESARLQLAAPLLTQYVMLHAEISDELIGFSVAQFLANKSPT